MSERCDFGAAKDDAIRDRLVVGISDKELSQRLQLKADLKLCDAITDIHQAEVVKAQVSAQSSATFRRVPVAVLHHLLVRHRRKSLRCLRWYLLPLQLIYNIWQNDRLFDIFCI